MKRKIFLHGKLRKLAPDGLEFDASTVEEAISALCRQTKAFNPLPGQRRHEIEVVGFSTEESLHAPLSDDVTELHLVPSMRGGKSGGVFQVIIGAVMVVVGAILYWCGGEELSAMGVGMMLGGTSTMVGDILQMISPAPKQDSNDPDASKYIGTPKNTTKIGTRIPIQYGTRLNYGQILSMDIEAVDMPLTYNALADTTATTVTLFLNGQTIKSTLTPPIQPEPPDDISDSSDD